MDFAAAFRALTGSGYDGWLTIEAFGRALPPLAVATRVWRDFFPSPTQVYREGYKFIFAVAGTKAESSVAFAAGRAAISIRHRGTVPNVAPRNS